jgi:excisionase family DNA binding protein
MTDTATRILYDKHTAAVMLSCSARQIDELRRSGRLLAVRMGREHKFRHVDLEAYANSLECA